MPEKGPDARRPCWCAGLLTPFSADYLRCATCGTLVCQVVAEAGKPVDAAVAGGSDSLDHRVGWLRTLLAYRLPPATVLELAHGQTGVTGLMRSAGYDVRVTLVGPDKGWLPPTAPVDVIVLDDVLEHLADPVAALAQYRQRLAPEGLLLVQTTEFPEWDTSEEMRAQHRPFLHALEPANGRLYLYSKRSVQLLFRRAGFSFCQFELPALTAHLHCVVSRQPVTRSDDHSDTHLAKVSLGPILRSLFDLDERAAVLHRAHRRSEEQLAEYAEAARQLVEVLTVQAEHKQRLEDQLAASEADRTARLEVIYKLDRLRRAAEADRDALHLMNAALAARLPRARLSRLKGRLRRLPGEMVQMLGVQKAS